MKIKPPLKWHGGKFYLASRIVALFPPHLHYVEPYAGGLSVLLARDPEGVSEVVNDVNDDLTTFWRTLQTPKVFELFLRRCEATPFSERSYEQAGYILENSEEMDVKAWAFFVLCRQSLAGRMKSFTGITRMRTRRGMNNEVSAWLTAIEGLPAVHERLKRVLILSRDALDVIRSQDGEKTLFYLDPSYLPETRTAPNVYAHEMSYDDHVELLDLIANVKGKVLLSGYPSNLYAEKLKDWWHVDFDMPNHSAGGGTKKRMTERVWANYEPRAAKEEA